MKNIIISILLSAMLIIMSFQPCYSHAAEVGSDVTQQVVLEPKEVEIVDTTDIQELDGLISSCKDRKASAHDLAEAARSLSYEEDHPVIQLARDEWTEASAHETHYKRLYDQEVAKQKMLELSRKTAEYPAASTVWNFLSSQGMSPYVVAGILGNMMSECGGQSLYLQPYLYNSTGKYYGVCQWSIKLYPGVNGASLEQQLSYLISNIRAQFNTYGNRYYPGFNYEKFLQLTNEKDAARAFLYCYGRGSLGSCPVRQRNATIALNYFRG